MRRSSKLILVASALAALAVPSVASAAPGSTGNSTNGSTKDVIGYAVSSGNATINAGDLKLADGTVENRGQWNKVLRTTDIETTWGLGADFQNTGDSVQWTRELGLDQQPAGVPGQADK
jgi:hypothetical protein